MAMTMQHDWSSWRTHDTPCGGNTWSKRLDSDSWEVRAFAEDASSSGQWPPRSYSCSFCQREFRTAQALGGHMNVHRRERAHANQLRASSAAAAAAATPKVLDTELSWLQSRLPPPGQSLSLSMSGPDTSPESISSSTKPLFQSIPDILLYGARAWHPYEKPRPRCNMAQLGGRVNLGRLNKVMDEQAETVLDLELRLGPS